MAAMGTVPKIDPWILPIEVYGVVYLYNPVDIERLGLDKVTEDTELEDTVDAPSDATASPPVPAPDALDDDKAESQAPDNATEAPADAEVPVPDDTADVTASGG